MTKKQSKRWGWKGKASLLLGSVVVSAVILELGVLVMIGEQAKFPRHVVGADFGVRINRPNSRYRHKSADVCITFRINGQGMRAGRDYVYEKPAGVQRIVSLGDSFTIGYEVDLEQCFSSVLERELRAVGHEVELLNAGVSGYSTAESLFYLERELFKYDPDIVLISFYGNDLVDNVRTNLFRLNKGELVRMADRYVPAGGFGDFLNSNGFFNFLSERSNAFVALKETATEIVKQSMVRQNLDHVQNAQEGVRTGTATVTLSPVDGSQGQPMLVKAGKEYDRRLTSAIFEQLYAVARERGIPLVIHSIPTPNYKQMLLREMFPLDMFDSNRPGVYFFSAKTVLNDHFGQRQLYWDRSQGHWTPFSHEVAGKTLARLVLEEELLTER